MTATNQNQEKFQQLLRELFQFDCADLDFGIYRIMNHKREVIEKFISEDLVKAVSEELDQGVLHDQEVAVSELKETADKVRENFGKDALDAAGNLLRYAETTLGKKYLKWQQRTVGARSRTALEAHIFNHLFAFFSRYYQEGDFISKRRYSKQQRYAIPYNGEEVYLHWANSDQYYIKTAEHFHDYSYSAYGATIHFKLSNADVEQNNVKGERRFFLPRINGITTDENAKELIIPFEYRPLNEQEEANYGRTNQQETIITEFVTEIRTKPELSNEILLVLTTERHRNADNEPVTYLEHHLRQYTRRNTSDFFIHKNLKAFLSQELDFYIKSEVLNLDDMEIAGEDFAEGWFQVIRVIRTMGGKIIDFLDQVEGFQKMLWEKRKFITEMQYCITIGNIDERFYPTIASCEPQWTEWKDLFHIGENETDLFNSGGDVEDKRLTFMKDHPALALDTRHFDGTFRDELLASIKDIDEQCDGLLIHSENWQALNILSEKYQEKIQSIYIDPPYNSKATEILYKNTYKHSSWLSLMENRIMPLSQLMSDSGVLTIAIDENEQERLGLLLDKLYPLHQKTCVSIVHNPGGIQGENFSYNNEFAYFIYPQGDRYIGTQKREENPDIRPLRDVSTGDHLRIDAANCFYPIYIKDNEIIRFGDVCEDDFHPSAANVDEGGGVVAIYPIDTQGNERKWVFSRQRIEKIKDELTVEWNSSRGIWDIIRRKTVFNYKTVWSHKRYNANSYGSKLLGDILGEKIFTFPKSVFTVVDCIQLATEKKIDDAVILDYFAGSGTTGHAVINLNREDGGKRKFILVEMGQYFDTVLLPRIKKVTFSPEWKNGKPNRMASREEAGRSPRIIKYLRLESYEDSLNNIGIDDAAGQQAKKFDDYLLNYMLRWETKRSETLLNVEQLARPFDYKLHIRNNGETSEKIVDLPETFNYMLGLHVQTRHTCHDEGRRYLIYRGLLDQRQVVVLWRETEGWQKAEMERDKQFVMEQKLVEDADEVYVNGDSFIPKARSLDPVFKARMFAPMSA